MNTLSSIHGNVWLQKTNTTEAEAPTGEATVAASIVNTAYEYNTQGKKAAFSGSKLELWDNIVCPTHRDKNTNKSHITVRW